MDRAPAIIIKQRWIDLILSGEKTWEIRGARFASNVGRRVFLARSGLDRAVVGHATLKRVIGPLSLEEFRSTEDRHCCAGASALPYKKTYALELTDVVRWSRAMAYAHPRGAITWVQLSPKRAFLERGDDEQSWVDFATGTGHLGDASHLEDPKTF